MIEFIKGIKKIGDFDVLQISEEMGVPARSYITGAKQPIVIDEDANFISFRIQKGPIKEVGVNGCQIDTVLEAATLMLKNANEKFPCQENAAAIANIKMALIKLDERRVDREKRGVEGLSDELRKIEKEQANEQSK